VIKTGALPAGAGLALRRYLKRCRAISGFTNAPTGGTVTLRLLRATIRPLRGTKVLDELPRIRAGSRAPERHGRRRHAAKTFSLLKALEGNW